MSGEIPSIDADLERHIDESLFQNINSSASTSPTTARAQPGASLLSPSARAQMTPSLLLSPEPLDNAGPPGVISPTTINTNSNMALLSPPGSRYAFDQADKNPVSPLLSSNNNPLIGNFNNTSIQRPLSAQSFNINTHTNDNFDSFRPFSAEPGLNLPERPLSSMEIDSITFKNDVANLVNWLNTLNFNQHKVVIDNLVDNLPVDVVNYAREKFEYYNYSEKQQNFPFHHPNVQEPVTLDSVLNSTLVQPTPVEMPTAIHLQRALSPNFPSFDRNALLQDVTFNRPRSADPYSRFLRNDNELSATPSKSRNRFDDENNNSNNNNSNNGNNNSFDITNLAQQLTQTPINVDYNNSNSLKLSALSTINSRAQLDSGKKRPTGQPEERGRGFHTVNSQHVFNINEELNKGSSSVPPPQRVNYYESISNSPSMNRVINKQRTTARTTPGKFNNTNYPNTNGQDQLSRLASLNSAVQNLSVNDEFQTPYKQQQQQQTSSSSQPTTMNNSPKSPAINPKQITNVKLLNDIPAWLKSLRLHKYTNALKDTPWKELIYLDDKQLEEKGVSAMGARGKLLKAFDVVKQHYEAGLVQE